MEFGHFIYKRRLIRTLMIMLGKLLETVNSIKIKIKSAGHESIRIG